MRKLAAFLIIASLVFMCACGTREFVYLDKIRMLDSQNDVRKSLAGGYITVDYDGRLCVSMDVCDWHSEVEFKFFYDKLLIINVRNDVVPDAAYESFKDALTKKYGNPKIVKNENEEALPTLRWRVGDVAIALYTTFVPESIDEQGVTCIEYIYAKANDVIKNGGV